MNGAGAGLVGGPEDFRGVQVALRGRGGTEENGVISLPHVREVPVGLRVDGDGRDAHPVSSADDAPGDLAPVGHEYGVKHLSSIGRSGGQH